MCTRSLIQLWDVDYILPEKDIFQKLSLHFYHCKTGLIGPNGIGKTTLFKLIVGEILPHQGKIIVGCDVTYVPQLNPHEKDISLSAGQKARLKLNAAFMQKQSFLLLDEPTNHLDKTARLAIYERIRNWKGGMIVISHDRRLLNEMDEIIELSSLGAKSYGGNFDFYQIQSKLEQQAAQDYFDATRKLVRKGKQKAQQRKERHEKNQAKGKKAKLAQIKAKGCYDKITFKSAQGKSEATHKRIVGQAQRKIQLLETQMQNAKSHVQQSETLSLPLVSVKVPQAKIMIQLEKLFFQYACDQQLLQNVNMTVQGPERIAITGDNARGKSTLLKIISGYLVPQAGKVYVGTNNICMVDQEAHRLDFQQTVIENYLKFNPQVLEKEAYRQLAHFLFKNKRVHQLVATLSGGELVRCQLACALFAKEPPQILLMDEPSNHLDFESMSHLENVLKEYQGVLIVVSHDEVFLENINIERRVEL